MKNITIVDKNVGAISQTYREKLTAQYGKTWGEYLETEHGLMTSSAALLFLYNRSYYEFFINNKNAIELLSPYSDIDISDKIIQLNDKVDLLMDCESNSLIIKTAFILAGGEFGGPPNSIYTIDDESPLHPKNVPFFVPKWIDTTNPCVLNNKSLLHFWLANKRIGIKNE